MARRLVAAGLDVTLWARRPGALCQYRDCEGVDVLDAPCCVHMALTVLDQLPEERSSSKRACRGGLRHRAS
jgi:hypothetical protein